MKAAGSDDAVHAKTAALYSSQAQQEVVPVSPVRQPFSAAAGSKPPLRVENIGELKEALIEQLQIEHSMLAIAVKKTLDWDERDGVLFISVHTPFEVQLLQKEKPLLSQKAAALYGKALKLQITLVRDKAAQRTSVPARVEMILRHLKGSIVDIQKKMIEEVPEEE